MSKPTGFLRAPVEELLSHLNTSLSGLSEEEVKRRLKKYGYNEVLKKEKQQKFIKFLAHLKNPLIILLLLAGLVAGFLGEIVETGIIFLMILMSVTLEFYQESKAERAAELLEKKITTKTFVIRNGIKREVKNSEIVPGDIIFLSAGDIVPGDARIISSNGLFVNQSVLTGEAFPVKKKEGPLIKKDLMINEWHNYVFMGTSVVSGSATAVVTSTGTYTEYGKIAKTLVENRPETEFESGLKKFGFLIMKITIFLVLVVFFINALFKKDVLESLLFTIALAVGLTPELLPVIVSINLSKGAIAMSKKGVIVKRLEAIQNFGSMDVLCTDKTGTLTENKIKLLLHTDIEGKENEKVLFYSFLNSFFETGLKSPLDEAILNYKKINVRGYRKIDEIPFEFNRKRISVILENKNEKMLFSKGSCEELTKVCSFCEIKGKKVKLTDKIREKILKKHDELSSKGFRVLGVSYKKFGGEKKLYSANDENNMIFIGFVAFIDPPKKTARKSLQLLKDANVELKILTGDNEIVTRNVCEKIGFQIKGVVSGNEISEMHDDALAKVVEKTNIFVKLTPPQKNRIINVLKGNGHVVGFLGDGINDAPSIKTADVGISVDNAVDVAKESADIILLKKSLTVLKKGVLEGRKTFGNTMKYIVMGTSSNFGNMFSVAVASLFLPFLPMLPIQILLNNFLYDVSELSIPLDNVDKEYVKKPKKLDPNFIRRFMWFMGPVSSLFDFLTFFIMIYLFKAGPALFQTAWFIESLCTQVLVIFIIRTRKTPFYKSKPHKFLIISSLSIIGIALIIPFTPIGKFFKFVAPPFLFFVFLAVLIVMYLVLSEFIKKQFYKKYAPN